VQFDVVVAGGGPGGSIFAGRLAAQGRRVLVLERERFPRFHLGESLLPQSIPILKEVGCFEEAMDRFIVKRGARFHDEGGRTSRYDFNDAFDRKTTFAFQVPRDEFDALLLDRARALGAEAREGWSVDAIVLDRGRAVGVEATDPAGRTHALDARMVVDATGRDALHAHATRATTKVPHLDKTALFSHFTGAWRDDGERAGDIQIVLFDAGWIWCIPFKDGRTSVGAVVSSAWMKSRRPGETVDALYRRALSESRVATRLLEGATQVFPAGAAADFSFRVRDLAGDGWLAVGDSGGFIDPLFSTGAHLAMYGGLHAADAAHAALAAGDVSAGRFSDWAAVMKRGADMFLGSVQAFYAGTLTDYIFAAKPHPFLRRAITSMLSGDVFDEGARWAKEMRARFPPAA